MCLVSEYGCPSLLAPETQNCSGRGVCVASLGCVCETAWDGQPDFGFGHACSINVQAVTALWSVTAVANSVILVLSLYYLSVRYRRTKGHYTIVPILVGLTTFFYSLCLVPMAVLRAVDVRSRAIGNDVAITVLFCFGSASFWASCYLTIYAFVTLSSRQASSGFMKTGLTIMLNRLKTQIWLISIAAVAACFMPFGMLRANSEWEVFGFASAHFFVLAVAMGFGGCYTIPTLVKPLEDDIRLVIQGLVTPGSGTKKDVGQYETVIKKMGAFRAELVQQSIANIITAVLFGSWPFLQSRGSSYFLPLAWISSCLVARKNLQVLLPVSSSGNGSSQKNSSQVRDAKVTVPFADNLEQNLSGAHVDGGSMAFKPQESFAVEKSVTLRSQISFMAEKADIVSPSL